MRNSREDKTRNEQRLVKSGKKSAKKEVRKSVKKSVQKFRS